MPDQEERRLVRLEVTEFEFDRRNLGHLALHGIDGNLIYEVAAGEPVFRLNRPAGNRTGTHLMIGPDTRGRFWTIVLVLIDGDAGIWRPITGWPSTRKEARTWQDAS